MIEILGLSFCCPNFTGPTEEKNAENLLVIRDKKLADRYTKNRQEHKEHSAVYGERGR